MAMNDFTGSDLLLVIAGLGSAAASVLGAWLANRHPEDEEEDRMVAIIGVRITPLAAEVERLRLHVAENFMPRTEVSHNIASIMLAIDNSRREQNEERAMLRDQVQEMVDRSEGNIREEVRDLRRRLDAWLVSVAAGRPPLPLSD